ncbi:hypothetical protein UFOVP237_51 [uncultured Caudovirales phage]|uniref:Uncharacterized protein n=1 Tax=uncultured Caudovirales phage TaxID=2100421 RepID=A0A6J7WPM8_9CAUD|nr:hypothetical protein UFOVP237_51 [uncultured Caudovirales phage]
MEKEEQGHWDHALMVNKLTDEIERLREQAHYHYEQGYWDHVLLVNKLTEEIERLREQAHYHYENGLKKDVEIERLREALKIFGAYADYLDEDYGDYPDHHMSKAFGGNILVFGDFRKARAALKEKD